MLNKLFSAHSQNRCRYLSWLAACSVSFCSVSFIFALELLPAAENVEAGQPVAKELGLSELVNCKHGFADSDGVQIHFVEAGEGPLVVMLHGFPDYWYSWRKQIPKLAENFHVVAIDQRGYNHSGRPAGVENYAMEKLVGDVVAVIEHHKSKQAIVIGHDWGGAVAWHTAMARPDLVERLVILNLPHPHSLARELAQNPAQRKASSYARFFQTDPAAQTLSAQGLAFWVTDEKAKPHYVKAFERSSFDAMLNYYKANYPREPYEFDEAATPPKVQCSVLMIHGLKDTALLPGGLNDTWKWLERDLTLITVPGAGHFVQQDAEVFVTNSIVGWLKRPNSP